MEIPYPASDGTIGSFELIEGSPIFLVGKNGSGKSAVNFLISSAIAQKKNAIQQIKNNIENTERQIVSGKNTAFFVTQKEQHERSLTEATEHFNEDMRCVKVAAHRINFLKADQNSMNGSSLNQFYNQTSNFEINPESRYRVGAHALNHGGDFEPLIFEMITKSNDFSQKYMRQHRDGETGALDDNESNPIDVINELLAQSSMSLRLRLDSSNNLSASHDDFQTLFPFARCSDGERSAVYIISKVVSANDGDVILLDEPERHLHSSIVRPLLSTLLSTKPNCKFLVSTHELSLPASHPSAKVLILDGCEWNGDEIKSWDIRELEDQNEIPEDVREAILGGRQKVLFVEGVETSLDKKLYEILYSEFNVVPVGSCQQVIQAVKGLNGSDSVHHATAFGLIDRDGRTEGEIKQLQSSHIFALNAWSVESLFYSVEGIEEVVRNLTHVASAGVDGATLIDTAKAAAIERISNGNEKEKIVAKTCLSVLTRQIQKQVPTTEEVKLGQNIQASEVSNPYQENLQNLDALISAGKYDEIIKSFNLKESNALHIIADKLGCKAPQIAPRDHYEAIFLRSVRTDDEFASKIRAYIPTFD